MQIGRKEADLLLICGTVRRQSLYPVRDPGTHSVLNGSISNQILQPDYKITFLMLQRKCIKINLSIDMDAELHKNYYL